MRILVSGFEPFGGESLNPTALLIKALQEEVNTQGQAKSSWSRIIPEGVTVHPVLLPVTFENAFEQLRTHFLSVGPDVVLSCGLAGGREAIEFERVAINCLDAEIADNAGFQPCDLEISPGGHTAFFSSLPLRDLVKAVQAAGVPAKISNSAGTYVCNFLLYRLLEMTQGTNCRAGFIHFPFLPEQTREKPGVSSLTFEQMTIGLAAVLSALKIMKT